VFTQNIFLESACPAVVVSSPRTGGTVLAQLLAYHHGAETRYCDQVDSGSWSSPVVVHTHQGESVRLAPSECAVFTSARQPTLSALSSILSLRVRHWHTSRRSPELAATVRLLGTQRSRIEPDHLVEARQRVIAWYTAVLAEQRKGHRVLVYCEQDPIRSFASQLEISAAGFQSSTFASPFRLLACVENKNAVAQLLAQYQASDIELVSQWKRCSSGK
jgi:hypothetical protein